MKNDNPPHRQRLIFAQNLRKIRRWKDLSQEALALNANVSRTYIGEVERGERSVSIDVMGRIADTLEVELVDLITENLTINIPN
ncbi:helix-turn-helix domain-containing protein [Moraxella sp. ZY210820]|uniref:helix-turn-helix domain-containing protein n=1 Tax=unclassified Moraxella TaxID=2685852 RepID=UPI00272F13BB|nr:helix-turn-helix transcriptional regulator [Moraxella sp. ZY210820]WLF83507.1 helix-turn-helix transcriptional regulator [Moraxella sp. ZY210820]